MLVNYADSDAGSSSDGGEGGSAAAVSADDAFGLKELEQQRTSKPEGSQQGTSASATASAALSSAPAVFSHDLSKSDAVIARPSDKLVYYNATYEDMTAPSQGPVNPFSSKSAPGGGVNRQNTLTGHVEAQAFDDKTFDDEHRSFNVLGYAHNPSILTAGGGSVQEFVGDLAAAQKSGGEMLALQRPTNQKVRATKRKRLAKGQLGEFDDEDDEEEAAQGEGEEGAGGGEEGSSAAAGASKKRKKEQKEYIGPWAGWEDDGVEAQVGAMIPPPGEDEDALEEAPRERRRKPIIDRGRNEVGYGQEKSVFHGKDLYDYLGRSYLHVPTDVDVNLHGESGTQECFVPKKCIHTWSGHTKGVSAFELFPGSGHLILSGSLDSRIKLWDVYHEGKCLRTFMGHGRAVHDVNFNNKGNNFLSAGFDRQMKLWDTETGSAIQAFSRGAIPYCIRFHPEQQNTFLAGMQDKKIVQYDTRSGEITQEYDHHLGPVNTITFVDDNRRFVTTSDDKSIRVWDFDIPVPIKYIAEPAMHSMPAVGMHPNKKWLAMQSLDNQILIFGSDSFKQNRKKRFAGHTVAGYACKPAFSPDGRFITSGDGQGNLYAWDWKNGRIISKIKAHSQALIQHAWLPHESSKVVTSSWDGLIKLWD